MVEGTLLTGNKEKDKMVEWEVSTGDQKSRNQTGIVSSWVSH